MNMIQIEIHWSPKFHEMNLFQSLWLRSLNKYHILEIIII